MLSLESSSEKDLSKIRDETLLQKIQTVIEEVENAESLLDVNNVKKLKADGDYYRIRIGDYRIGLTISDGIIVFVRALQRKDIYRYFP
ncbi:type II toxin-antitoxin system RelE/ParE family toxin [Nostoc spongiaeforme FACHB-130]|uniref:Type II toxin-antitoxin system RelE/ParE family toxin n=1 Tax=Nostoc spongiaeforme FACHB-130 TaxID=1357510 RepID=A0ABR8FWT2_9NOSO|nr:type II toxin-antitoxin system RelE/ParE family toxin [Nostoc spongiaeforme]MBD2595791.1 type II toxin-antitoxin system RelE/ParE family toxin [Nostoc spongiaeforme FACHB-130]